ncbi:DEAD/DEAH box helicase [Archaeoglobus neptunius]|uniref:DEAD/DEAH box helicase n=1 Tax=Archaeoglobus neptunius TaxID=2798580 RepID=UPI0019254DB7
MEFITHPLIKENTVERRMYQVSIAATALVKNTLVVIPTGLGKTTIAALVIASRLLNEKGRVLFLAPTKPLVEQHAIFLRRVLKISENEIVSLSGEIGPDRRKEIWNGAKIVVSTPQVIENDILAGRITLKDVVLIVFDEAHRAVGNYSYVFIAREYLSQAEKPLILGMTASPGSDAERIMEVIQNLSIETIEVRTEWDSDVSPYVGKKDIEWVKVEMPEEMKEVRKKLEECIKLRFKRLSELGIDIPENAAKKDLLALQEALQAEVAESRDPNLYDALSILAEIMKLQHAVELIETQGIRALKLYLKKLIKESSSKGSSRAAKNIVNDTIFRSAVIAAARCKVEHPKLKKLEEIIERQLREKEDSRIIVFTNYRDSAEMIVSVLSDRFPVAKFVGQASRENDRGMRQKEQIETLERFRRGEYRILVATSVGEEGLDIPSTDLVIFYEAVPSEIRAIQRKGRTGRGRKGKIVVLMTRGTKDEAYYYTSIRKERKMYEMLLNIKDIVERRRQKTLTDFEHRTGQKIGVRILVDSRELRSDVVKHLREFGASIEVTNLETGDYVLSDRVAVERKTVDDFVNSITHRDRLFSQIGKLKSAYSRPVLIIEGDSIYRGLHPNAVRGAIASIAIDFSVPIIQTRDARETAEFILAMARREQEIKERAVVEHVAKTKRTLKEEQEHIVSAISNVGVVIAKNLLDHFQTIERIATADEDELAKVPKVGRKTAKRIRRVMTTPYSEADFYDSETF